MTEARASSFLFLSIVSMTVFARLPEIFVKFHYALLVSILAQIYRERWCTWAEQVLRDKEARRGCSGAHRKLLPGVLQAGWGETGCLHVPGIPDVPVGSCGRVTALDSTILSSAAWLRDGVSTASVPPDRQTGGSGVFPCVQLLLLVAVV